MTQSRHWGPQSTMCRSDTEFETMRSQLDNEQHQVSGGSGTAEPSVRVVFPSQGVQITGLSHDGRPTSLRSDVGIASKRITWNKFRECVPTIAWEPREKFFDPNHETRIRRWETTFYRHTRSLLIQGATEDKKGASSGLERIRQRQPEAIRRAEKFRSEVGDPISELTRILGEIPVDDETWERIIEEPYG